MIWLQTPPWGRRLLAAAIVSLALWIELRPEPTVEHPFATETITRGTEIGSANTEMRQVSAGLLQPVRWGAVAIRDVGAGDPVLHTDVGSEEIPVDWWAVSLEVPQTARSGDLVRVVNLDTGQVADGIVVAGPDSDPLGGGLGSVALPGEAAAAIAIASMDGRVAVMVSPS
jgi:flagella basal body P-ring formation protein FlgA